MDGAVTTRSAEDRPSDASVVPPRGAAGAAPAAAPSLPQADPGTRLSFLARHRRRHRGAALLGGADVSTCVVVALVFGGLETAPLLLGPVVCGTLALNARAGLYRPGLEAYALEELPALLSRAAVVWCAATGLLASFLPAGPSLPVLAGAVVSTGVLAGTARAVVHGSRRRRARKRPRPALVVGHGDAARAVAAVLAAHPRYGLRPIGFVDPHAGDGAVVAPLPVITAPEDVVRAVIQNEVGDVVFLRPPWGEAEEAALARLLGERGLTGWLIGAGTAPDGRSGPAGSAHVWGFSCRRLDLEPARLVRRRRKRLLDLLLVVPALVVAAPLLVACALAVRLSDGPGVLFRQERIGLGSRPFVLLKFRSLRPADEWESATRWSVADDARMSRVGRVLRRTSLDELPQLWNVLRGDMSLVGPRPERLHFVEQFSRRLPGYADRHRAPAGITGLAQVHGLRGDTSIEDRARLDNHYIDTWSLRQDLQILCRTAASAFRQEGA
nr:exopolysaccharide biosynthesis polyprenyl glycosylphosphotransferase [Streptomyces xiaopingdaonensis]